MAIMCTIPYGHQSLTSLTRQEGATYYDRFAVVVLKGREVVGHVPRTLSKTNSSFLRYDDNMVFCEVTGERVNQLGVEVPCVYKCYGCRSLITKQR